MIHGTCRDIMACAGVLMHSFVRFFFSDTILRYDTYWDFGILPPFCFRNFLKGKEVTLTCPAKFRRSYTSKNQKEREREISCVLLLFAVTPDVGDILQHKALNVNLTINIKQIGGIWNTRDISGSWMTVWLYFNDSPLTTIQLHMFLIKDMIWAVKLKQNKFYRTTIHSFRHCWFIVFFYEAGNVM